MLGLTAVTLLLFGVILFSGLFLSPADAPTGGPTPSPGVTSQTDAQTQPPTASPPSPSPSPSPSPQPLSPVFTPLSLSVLASSPTGYSPVREETRQPEADFISTDGLCSVTNKSLTQLSLDLDALCNAVTFAPGVPTVVLYHTHGSEGYETTDKGLFLSDKDGLAGDRSSSVRAVGDVLAEELTALGVNVIHLGDLFDTPSRSGSFKRSRAAVEKVLASLDRVDLVIDLHRGTLPCSDGSRVKPTVLSDGKKTAQITLIACYGGDQVPLWQERLGIALCLQREMNRLSPYITLPVALETQTYNLDMEAPCLMVEVGTDVNTSTEAARAAVFLARGVVSAIANNTSDR